MTRSVDVLVIGAGPYGLSLAAHLRAGGVDFRIIGEPMGGWKHHMPKGMLLKSQPWASSLASPDSAYSIGRFCAEKAIDYDPVTYYVPIETFIAYGESFERRYVPNVERQKVIALKRIGGGFRAHLDNGEIVKASRVVVAVGMAPFKYLPPVADQVPSEFVSHSSDYGPFDELHGKRVVVVGSGSSAIDLAALLHERGIEVRLLARAGKLNWGEPPVPRPLYQRLRYPDSGIGTSWPFMVAVYAPWAVHHLPDSLRLRFAYTGGLGPLGGFPMRVRLDGKVPVRLGRTICAMNGDGRSVDLHVAADGGDRQVLSADHVVFATGYRVDVSRLRFLEPQMMARIALIGAAPRLSRYYESSVPGLHFIGPAAAPSFGPVLRFVFGTGHPARQLSRYFIQRRGRMPIVEEEVSVA